MNTGTPQEHNEQGNSGIFWGEMAPSQHLLQIYETDDLFIESLGGFLTAGLTTGDVCIAIATKDHLSALEEHLHAKNFDVAQLVANKSYIPLNAEDILSQFMVNGWPDEALFNSTIATLFEKAGYPSKKIRAFGEMVALLWAQGLNGATVFLEHLWNEFLSKKEFCLFCAYPSSGFTEEMTSSLKHICKSHSQMITASGKPIDEETLMYNITRGKVS